MGKIYSLFLCLKYIFFNVFLVIVLDYKYVIGIVLYLLLFLNLMKNIVYMVKYVVLFCWDRGC